MRKFDRPRRFDRNLVVIGAGAAGLVAAYVAAAARARVSLIEGQRMGGDCLYTGCVPSKALIHATRLLYRMRRAGEFGLRTGGVEADFARVMERVQGVITRIAPHDSEQRYTRLGVECLHGMARIISPWSVGVNGRTLTTRAIVIAAGARPAIPPIPGIETIECLTSDNLWSLRELPRRLLVLGGGPVGCELAQCFARLGSEVCLVERLPHLLGAEDPEVSELIETGFRDEGIRVLTGHQATSFHCDGGRNRMLCSGEAGPVELAFDRLLVAAGRTPRTRGYGLEDLGIAPAPGGTIATDACLRTSHRNVYACGDVTGPYQFTHSAAHQAWYAAVNALLPGWKQLPVDYSVIPHSTFTDPEVAGVGLNESAARAAGIACEVSRYDIGDLDRAIADGTARGSVKVLTTPGRDRILGVTCVGEHAGDIITEFVSAMRHGLGLRRILRTIHIYPTLAEANRHVAGVWQQNHLPHFLLGWAARWHRWRLG